MKGKDLESALSVLNAMKDAEIEMSKLYALCALRWEKDTDFWNSMAEAEVRHAESLEKISGMLRSQPEHFQIGRSFHLAALRTFVSGVRSHSEKISRGEMTKAIMMNIARDLEQSLVEFKYSEIVKSNDPEFNSMIKSVVEDTRKHKSDIEEEIKKQRS